MADSSAIWEEANKRLGAEKPDLEKEIARIDGQMAKTRATIDRYFEAFEAGTLKAELCNEKVRDLRSRMEGLEGEKRSLEARRERLELPAIDKEMLRSLLDNFEKVMAEGENPKKKHLLHQLLKKVLIHSRDTIEVWYCLPNPQRFANCNIWLPKCASMRSRPGLVEPDVYFRIVHNAHAGHNNVSVATYREQTVEIAVESKGVFKNDPVANLTRRTPVERIVSAISPLRGNAKPPKEPKPPRVAELLKKAIEWQALLDAGKIVSQVEIASGEGIICARVSQVLGMLRLAPEIQKRVLTLPVSVRRTSITERLLRPITAITDYHDQIREFQKLLG